MDEKRIPEIAVKFLKGKRHKKQRKYQADLVENSPLRKADPRIKLALSLSASLAVMMNIIDLIIVFSVYLLFLAWARLLPSGLRQLWKIKWILIFLFIGDWLLVSSDLAVLITLRISLLALAFNLLFSTTTPSELTLALAWLRVPYRYAFSISMSFQSIASIDAEWRMILEAQKSRGAVQLETLPLRKYRSFLKLKNMKHNIGSLISLTVPAIVLIVRRAWAVTEAASARGFDSPKRKPYRKLKISGIDILIIILMVLIVVLIKSINHLF